VLGTTEMHTYDFEGLDGRGGREQQGDAPRLGDHIDRDEDEGQAFPVETADGHDNFSSVEREDRTLPPPASGIRRKSGG